MGNFVISEGNIKGGKEKENKNKNSQNRWLTSAPSGEVAQMLTSATSNQRLNREVWAALLRVRTRPECPKGNLRELTRDSNPDCEIAIS